MTPRELKLEKQIRNEVLDLHAALLKATLDNSHGLDTMNEMDIKSAIVSLYLLTQNQQHLINYLYKFLLSEPQTPWYKRIFRK